MTTNSNNIRLHFLDGLRGWASFVVLLSHLFQSWLCGVPTDNTFVQTLFFYLKTTPFYLSIDGNSAVYMFFIISGIALSYKSFMDYDVKSVIRMAQFRYFRLAIPIFFSSLFAYTLLVFGLMYNNQFKWFSSSYKFEPSFIGVLWSSLYNTFFSYTPAESYNPIFWSMPLEFKGSLVIFAFLCFFGSSKLRYVIYLLSFFLFYTRFYALGYLPFLLGLMISDIYCYSIKKENKNVHIKTTSFVSLLLISIFFLFYQKYVVKKSPLPYFDDFSGLAGIVSMALLMISILINSFFQRIFSCRISQFMGRISFSLYLVHFPIITSFSSYLYLILSAVGTPPALIIFFTSSLTIFISILCAYIFTLLIEEIFLKKFKNIFMLYSNISFIELAKQLFTKVAIKIPNIIELRNLIFQKKAVEESPMSQS